MSQGQTWRKGKCRSGARTANTLARSGCWSGEASAAPQHSGPLAGWPYTEAACTSSRARRPPVHPFPTTSGPTGVGTKCITLVNSASSGLLGCCLMGLHAHQQTQRGCPEREVHRAHQARGEASRGCMWRCEACAGNLPSDSGDCAGSTGWKLCGAALLNRKPGMECLHRNTASTALHLLNFGTHSFSIYQHSLRSLC